MKYKIGDIVKVKSIFLGEPANVLAYVYEEYNLGFGDGVSIITENGVDLGGFSEEEQDEFLEFVMSTDFHYVFSNVIKLDNDFETYIKPIFNLVK